MDHFVRIVATSCLAGLAIPAAAVLAQPPKVTAPPSVVVAPIVAREMQATQSFVGTVMPARRSIVGSAVDGRVVEVAVEEGQAVKAGDTLVKLLTKTIEIERDAADFERQYRAALLDEMNEGARKEEKDQASARMERAKATNKYAQQKLARMKDLRARNTITADEEQSAQAQADEALQAEREAVAAYTLIMAGNRLEKVKQAQAQMKTQEQVVARLDDILSKYTIKSPFDGYVTSKLTETGEWVQQGKAVAEVVELKYVDVHVQVLESYLSALTLGRQVTVQLAALPGESFSGEVFQVVPQADVRSRNFPVKVRVKNVDRDGTPLLKAGMFARVTLPTGRMELANLAPKDALVLGGTQPMVFVLESAGKDGKPVSVKRVSVQTGMADRNLIQVVGESVKAGDLVVVEGNERLVDGQLVSPIAQAAQPQPAEAKTTTKPAEGPAAAPRR